LHFRLNSMIRYFDHYFRLDYMCVFYRRIEASDDANKKFDNL